MIKSRILDWAGHIISRMEKIIRAIKNLTGKLQERDFWEGLGVGGRQY